MIFFHHLLKQLGLLRTREPRKYGLDVSLQPLLESMAEHQQRSPDEMVSDLVDEAISGARSRLQSGRRLSKRA